MAKLGEHEKAKPAKPTDELGSVVVESKHCSALDLETIKKSAGHLLETFTGMTKDEKQRLAQRTAEKIKKKLGEELGGNWNVIMGKELQISVGLTPQCRLFRMKSGVDRLFCFETYTKVEALVKDKPETDKKVQTV